MTTTPESSEAGSKKPRPKPRTRGSGSIFQPKGSPYYWIAYHSNGQRYFENTKSKTKMGAQTVLTQRLGDVGRGVAVTPKLGKKSIAAGLRTVVEKMRQDNKDSVRCEICKVACCGVKGHSNSIQRQIDKHILRLEAMSPHAATSTPIYRCRRSRPRC